MFKARFETVVLDGQEYTKFDSDALALTISSIKPQHLAKSSLITELCIIIHKMTHFPTYLGQYKFGMQISNPYYTHATNTWEPSSKATVLKALMKDCIFWAIPFQQRLQMTNFCFPPPMQIQGFLDTSKLLRILNIAFVDMLVAFYQLECNKSVGMPIEIIVNWLFCAQVLGVKVFKSYNKMFEFVERVFVSCERVLQKRRYYLEID